MISYPMIHDRVPYAGQTLGLMDRDRIPGTSEGAPNPVSGDASMIVRVQFDLDSGSLKYQNKMPVHVAHDAAWKCLLLGVPEIQKTANFGDGFQVGNATFTVDDIDDDIRGSSDIWTGKPVTIYFLEEVDTDGYGAWALVERDRWIGAVDRRGSPDLSAIEIKCTENQGQLGESIPADTITSAEYPSAPDSSLGKPIPLRAGTFSQPLGALEALAIDTPVGDPAGKTRRFVLNGISAQSVEGVFVPGSASSSDYVAPPAGSWAMYNSGGRAYIWYKPPTGSSTVPDEAPDSIRVNFTEGHTEPTECLKAVLDGCFRADVFFSGAPDLNSEYLLRGYVGQINLDEKREVKSLVSDFCANFDCFARIGSDGKLVLGLVNPTSVATFGRSQVLTERTSESEVPDNLANHATMRWGYNWSKSEYAAGDLYRHASSIAAVGRYDQEYEYSMTDDRDTAIDVTRRRVRQVRSVPRELNLELMFEDQTGVQIGDVITVEDDHLLRTGSWLYVVKGKRIIPDRDSVVLVCQSYSNEVDHLIEVTRNMEGADIDPFGLAVVGDGDDLTIVVDPDDYHSVDYYWRDLVSAEGSGNTYTLSNVIADHVVMVVLQTDYWPITASDDDHCTIDPKNVAYVPNGGSQSFTAEFDDGYEFSKWVVDGVNSTVYPYVFSGVAAEHAIQCVSNAVVTGYVTVTIIIRSGSAGLLPFPAGATVTNKGRLLNEIYTATATQVKLNGVDRTAGNTRGISFYCNTDMTLELWF